MVNKSWIEKAEELRAQGLSYAKIGVAVGKSAECIHYTLNPKARKHRNQIKKKRYQDNRQEVLNVQAKYYQENKKRMLKQHAEYKRDHKKETAITRKIYRGNHGAEHNADEGKRRALKRGITAGDLDRVKEIYRIAKEEPRVRCYICRDLIPMGHRHVDHITPISRGGSHRPSTIAVTCDECNLKKSDKMPNEMGILL